MREIKFRGRSSKDNKTWFIGSLVYLSDIDEAYIDHYDGLRRVIERYPVNTATVGQFTGLLDSNGQEIYEGDIVRFELPPMVLTNEKTAVGVVVYEYGQFLVIIHAMRFTIFSVINDCTVIGNVHDNPDLLEVEHD